MCMRMARNVRGLVRCYLMHQTGEVVSMHVIEHYLLSLGSERHLIVQSRLSAAIVYGETEEGLRQWESWTEAHDVR